MQLTLWNILWNINRLEFGYTNFGCKIVTNIGIITSCLLPKRNILSDISIGLNESIVIKRESNETGC